MMRIVVWGINYPPELTGIAPCNGALCEFLAEMGNDVTMLTAFPYYPDWRKQAQDAGKLFGSETLNGVQVVRCWHYVPSRPNTLKRILHELSFVAVSLIRLLFASQPDLLIAISPPLLLGVVARTVCWLRGGRYLVHIQDLQPDAAIRLGMVRSGMIIDFLRRVECSAYRGAWRVSAISHGMLEALRKRGVSEEKLIYFPNGIEFPRLIRVGRFRERNRFSADRFLVVYSGNIGVKQGLETLIAAAKIVRNRSIQLIVCGEGAEKKRLLAAAHGLPNVWFKCLLDEQSYQEMLADADLLVISLVPGCGNSFFPHKLLSSCAASKPVLAVCDSESELARTVRKNRCGVVVPPQDTQYLAQTLDALSSDQTRLKTMSHAARAFAEQFQRGKVLKEFWEQVENADGHPASVELAVSDP
jgi:colanic acid biosynthesis glycosyl transferase WcaI